MLHDLSKSCLIILYFLITKLSLKLVIALFAMFTDVVRKPHLQLKPAETIFNPETEISSSAYGYPSPTYKWIGQRNENTSDTCHTYRYDKM